MTRPVPAAYTHPDEGRILPVERLAATVYLTPDTWAMGEPAALDYARSFGTLILTRLADVGGYQMLDKPTVAAVEARDRQSRVWHAAVPPERADGHRAHVTVRVVEKCPGITFHP